MLHIQVLRHKKSLEPAVLSGLTFKSGNGASSVMIGINSLYQRRQQSVKPGTRKAEVGGGAALTAKAAIARIAEDFNDRPPISSNIHGARALRRQGSSRSVRTSSASIIRSSSRSDFVSSTRCRDKGQPIGEGHEVVLDRFLGESDADLSLPGALTLMTKHLEAKATSHSATDSTSAPGRSHGSATCSLHGSDGSLSSPIQIRKSAKSLPTLNFLQKGSASPLQLHRSVESLAGNRRVNFTQEARESPRQKDVSEDNDKSNHKRSAASRGLYASIKSR